MKDPYKLKYRENAHVYLSYLPVFFQSCLKIKPAHFPSGVMDIYDPK